MITRATDENPKSVTVLSVVLKTYKHLCEFATPLPSPHVVMAHLTRSWRL